jgi:chromosome segregation ATPase
MNFFGAVDPNSGLSVGALIAIALGLFLLSLAKGRNNDESIKALGITLAQKTATRLDVTEADLKAVQASHNELKTKYDALLQLNLTKERDLSALKIELETERTATVAKDKTIAEMSDRLGKLQEQITALTARIAALETQIVELRTNHALELSKRDDTIKAREAEITSLKVENADLKAKLAAQTTTTTTTNTESTTTTEVKV